MEHVHVAPSAGRVLAMWLQVGEQVAARSVLAEVADPAVLPVPAAG